MELCPTDAVLVQMIADALSVEEQVAVEAHLTGCGKCRQRIDALGEVAAISAIVDSAESSPQAESLSLRLVMERLLIETQLLSSSAAFTAKTSRDVLPMLQPTARPGFIGRLGEIDVRKVIGRGGMGVVFEGVDRILNRTVAIKMLSPHLIGDEEAKSRFLREAQAAAALSHENVVSIHAIDEADGMPYLVLQYVSGESLAERLVHEKKLPFSDVVRIGIQTARGLAAAHEHGLIHRDVKPANILLEAATGDVRIADFGLAKRAGYDSITEVGAIAGTPAYMSPEQAIDGKLDARSDLFSLGVVLYEASSGVSPFAADSPFVVLNKIRTHNPRSVCELNPELPVWFSTIVQRLLEKKSENRIGSASELAQLLERQSGVGRGRNASTAGSRRLLVGLALSGIIGFLIGAAFYFRTDDAPPSRPPSHLPMVGFAVNGIAEHFATLAEAIHAAPDNGVIDVHGDGPYSTPTITIDGKRLTIRAAAGARPRFVPDVTGEKGPPQFLNSNVDLRLEGLEVIWPIPSPQSNLEDSAQRCVIRNTKGKLTLSFCRVVAGSFGVCVGTSGSDVVAEHCHLASESGACLAWQPTIATVRIEHCILEGKIILFTTTHTAGTTPTRIHFAFNTVVAERVMNLITINPIRKTMAFTASGNLIDSQVIIALYTFGGFQQGPGASAKMTNILRSAISWKDESNVYRRGSLYLAGNPRQQPLSALPSDVKALDTWLAFWMQPASKSIEGTIRFGERTGAGDTTLPELSPIDTPSGPIPQNVGANPAEVGPGPAYHARPTGKSAQSPA